MNRFREFLRRAVPAVKRAFTLPPGVILILTPTTMVLCIIALNNRGLFPALEYIIYAVSAYALAALIIGLGDVSRYVEAASGTGRTAIRSQICSSVTSVSAGSCRCIRVC